MGNITYSSDLIHRPKQWIRLTRQRLKSGTSPYVDLRIAVYVVEGLKPNLRIKESVGIIGGVWHDYQKKYMLSLIDTPFYKTIPSTTWYISENQAKIFKTIPKILDPYIDIPLLRIIAFGGRRTGKSEIAIKNGIALAVLNPCSIGEIWGYNYVQNIDKTGGLIDKIRASLPDYAEVEFRKKNREMFLRNGSVISFKSSMNAKSARSTAPDWAILDEPSFYDNVGDVMKALAPALLEKAGPMMMITSPNGFDEVYYETRKRFDPEPLISKSMVFVDFGSTFNNPFLSEKAKKAIKIEAKNMSKDVYNQEILGKVINVQGLVFYDFSRKKHVIKTEDALKIKNDVTAEFCKNFFPKLSQPYEIICGMDFNENPISFNAFKIMDDGTFHCIKELFQYNANTSKFVSQALIPWLRVYYEDEDLTDSELLQKILIIGDASGQWQEFGKNIKAGKTETPAFRQLKAFKIRVLPPQRYSQRKKRRKDRSRNKKHTYARNPSLGERMNSARSRLQTHEEKVYLTIDPECQETIKMMESIDLKDGLPNKSSKYIHNYDSCTYPVYRFFPATSLDRRSNDLQTYMMYRADKILDQIKHKNDKQFGA
jgi:hypothetical protein